MKSLYLKNNTVLINFTSTYYQTIEEVLASDNFRFVLEGYIDHLSKNDIKSYRWFINGYDKQTALNKMIHLLKLLCVIDVDQIQDDYLKDKKAMIVFVENLYNYWRKLQRCTMINTRAKQGLQLANFIDADNKFNQLMLALYRKIEENVQGRKNNVYRQLNAGSNASMVVRDYRWAIPKGYEVLKGIPFIDSVMLRTPLLLHPASNKRSGTFSQIKTNPITSFSYDKDEWFCYPAKIGSLLTYIYFHCDYIFSALALANLFELALDKECYNKKPDLIMLFGNKDGKDECTFYHDTKNEIWVGNVSYKSEIEYFGYLKKMALTLHNLAMIQKGWLPLHGSMINITLKNGQTKGIVFIGDSGAGKSETIEAIQNLGYQDIISTQVIFDDMGSLHIGDDEIYAQGTEIGAFVRLDDLEKGSAYKEMDRSIFFNPETSNARVVIPVVAYDEVITDHKIDMFMYANNYTKKIGLRQFETLDEAIATFCEGKRFALGTTSEKGISTTFFANPFGPVQKEEECLLLIKKMFKMMKDKNIFLGEVYTQLGLKDKDDNALMQAAQHLLKVINNEDKEQSC
ncbi:MAG: hypothetical protein PHP11_02490 [Erysipelotrichaceae bacterium]|nr:hypothetical protein [Erysipelotrichaceae bacterium]MDD4642229.1 hypothetical protein [Erysipelotrichaceae bacterium]